MGICEFEYGRRVRCVQGRARWPDKAGAQGSGRPSAGFACHTIVKTQDYRFHEYPKEVTIVRTAGPMPPSGLRQAKTS